MVLLRRPMLHASSCYETMPQMVSPNDASSADEEPPGRVCRSIKTCRV